MEPTDVEKQERPPKSFRLRIRHVLAGTLVFGSCLTLLEPGLVAGWLGLPEAALFTVTYLVLIIALICIAQILRPNEHATAGRKEHERPRMEPTDEEPFQFGIRHLLLFVFFVAVCLMLFTSGIAKLCWSEFWELFWRRVREDTGLACFLSLWSLFSVTMAVFAYRVSCHTR